MEILEKIFGNLTKIKAMKLFIFNPNLHFDLVSVAAKTKVNERQSKKDLLILEKIGLLRKKDIKNKKGRKLKSWGLNVSFEYLAIFREFFLGLMPFTDGEIVQKLSKAGRLKVVAISGIFLHNEESTVDLLVAGDRLNKGTLGRVIKEIESGLGKEIKYVILDTEDFVYRLGVRDKLIRDVFDYPNNLILDKVGVQV